MLICFSCQKQLPNRGNFCPQCGIQVRCKECQDVLEANARACVMCGTLVGQGTGSIPTMRVDGSSQSFNTLKIVEVVNKDGRSREVHVQATNEAVGEMRVFLDDYRKQQALSDGDGGSESDGFEHTEIKKIGQSSTVPSVEDDIANLSKGTEQNKEVVQETTAAVLSSSEQKGGRELIKQVFSFENDHFRLKEPRLKAENKKDYAKRLSCLLVLAYEVAGKETATRKALNEILKKHKVLDPNSIGWISKCSELEKDGESIRLNNPGYELASKALNEIFDPNVKTKWMPDSQSTSNNDSKGKAPNGNEKAQKSIIKTTGKSKIVEKWASEWKVKFPDVDGHTILKDKSSLDKSLMALWAIRKISGDQGKEVSDHLLSLFMQEVFEIKMFRRNITNALTAGSAKDKVIKVSASRFQINPTGMAYVEKFVKGTAK